MPTKLKIVAGAVALAVSYGLGFRRSKTKIETLSYAYAASMVEIEKFNEKTKYLLHILEERGVILSDFDLIVLTHDIEESES